MGRTALLGCLLVLGCSATAFPEIPVAECGDNTCTPIAETCASCAQDCGDCGTCGDGTCNATSETCADCPADCGECEAASCGDGTCAAGSETCTSCPSDCGACGSCGDGTCDAEIETCTECPQDCGACAPDAVCGDGTCSAAGGEDCSSCSADCGACAHCGNGTCELAEAETCTSCPQDCGACKTCGDDVCNKGAGETCSNCAADCGRCDPCGDGVCRAGAGETCQSCAKDCGACEPSVRKGCVQGSFSAFHGNLHAHTSYSDGALTPAAAFDHARRAGLDFMHVTDHKGQMSDGQWDACRAQANQANAAAFVTGCGYEIVITEEGASEKQLGHINFLFPPRRTISPQGLDALYQTLTNCEGCIGQWNHPPWPGTFGNYRFFAKAKPQMRLIEFSGRGTWGEKMDAYFTALRNGWRVSPSMNEDNHMQNWGERKYATGVFASDLTRGALREAIEDNRTFAAADDTASIAFKADEKCWMGSVLQGLGKIELSVVARDRQDGDGFKSIELRGVNGGVLESKACRGTNPCTAKFSRAPGSPTFFVATATQTDGDVLVSAPIWLERL